MTFDNLQKVAAWRHDDAFEPAARHVIRLRMPKSALLPGKKGDTLSTCSRMKAGVAVVATSPKGVELRLLAGTWRESAAVWHGRILQVL